MRGRNGLPSPPEGLFCQGLRSPCGAPPGGLLLHGRSPRGGPPGGLSLQGLFGEPRRSPRESPAGGGGKPCATPDFPGPRAPSDLSRGFSLQGRLPAPPGLPLHGRSPRGASPDGLLLHGFRWARGPVGLVCHGRSPGGAPPAGLSFQGLFGEPRRSPRESPAGGGGKPCATSDFWRGFPVQGRLPPPPGLLLQGRSPRGGPAGLSRHPPPLALEADEGRRGSRGADETKPGLSRSRCVAGSFSDHARSGRFFFLKRSRGSLCVPPGRQSLPRRSAPSGRSAPRSRGAEAACLRI